MGAGAGTDARVPRSLAPAAAPIAVWALAMLIAMRTTLLSGFAIGFGDRGDALIEIALLEHWRNVWMGAEAWNAPLYFHPHGGTLGYNDGYFLYGLSYGFWRLFADPFVADGLNVLTFKTLGFFGAYALAVRTLGWRRGVGLAVALLFSIANNLVLQSGNVQLVSIALLPWIAMLAIGAWRAAAGEPRRARWLGVGAGALMAAWLSTGFYLAWFTLWFVLVVLLCWAGVNGNWRPKRAIALIRPHWTTLTIIGGVTLVLLLPFLSVYLPKAMETGGHSVKGMRHYLATPIDWINVGPGNLVWGWAQPGLVALGDAIGFGDPVNGRVREVGFPLLIFGLYIAATVRVIRHGSGFLKAFALAIAVSWLLTLKLGILSPWQAVFELVPGAKGLRVVFRYQLFLVLPVLLLIAAAWRERLAAMRVPVLAGLTALLAVEQLNSATPARLVRAEQLVLEAIPRPPRGCASFYVVAARVNEPLFFDAGMHALYPHNVDAMYLAERWRVPTVGGFSTFNPPDWDFADATASDYDARVLAYAARHGLKGLCRLDMREPVPWRKLS